MSNSPLYARQMAKQFVDNVSVAEAGKEQGFEGNAIASIGGVLEEFLKAAKKGKEKRNFPPTVRAAANARDKYTAVFLMVRAIFLELVRANQFKNK